MKDKIVGVGFVRLDHRVNTVNLIYSMGSTQVESPICRARSQICKQYMLGVRFVLSCHLALVGQYTLGFGLKMEDNLRLKKDLFSTKVYLPQIFKSAKFCSFSHKSRFKVRCTNRRTPYILT